MLLIGRLRTPLVYCFFLLLLLFSQIEDNFCGAVVEEEGGAEEECDSDVCRNGDDVVSDASYYYYTIDATKGIQHYFNPNWIQNRTFMEKVREGITDGRVVIIKNAFLSEFADALHRDLSSIETWAHHSDYYPDGFIFSHHNLYEWSDWSALVNATHDMFSNYETRRFMTDFLGVDCMGEIQPGVMMGSPSNYHPGDFSNPHCDWGRHDRSVAFVWHLSKDWRPEWGGALYWIPENSENSWVHASYNTLVLFAVRPKSNHFVTTVSPHAESKRLAFNGWWQSSWKPTVDNTNKDVIVDLLNDPWKRQFLTHGQYRAIETMVRDAEKTISRMGSEAYQELSILYEHLSKELFSDKGEDPTTMFIFK